MTTWAFILLLTLPGSQVDVRAVATAASERACNDFRQAVLAALGGRGRGELKTTPTPQGGLVWKDGSLTKCEKAEPIKP